MIVSPTVPDNHRQAYCRHCNKQVMAVVRKPNHTLHLILTILFCVWGIIWIAIAVDPSYRCSRCGAKTGRGRPSSEAFD